MMPYTSLRQKTKEVLSEFLRLYPAYQEFSGQLLELTEKHVSQRLADMSRASLERYFIGHQLRVDITVELTKVAMLLKEFPETIAHISPLSTTVTTEPTGTIESILSKNSTHFTYEKRGNVIYLPFRFGVSLS